MIGAPPVCGAFSVSGNTASANTVFRRIIPPFTGNSGSPPKLYKVDSSQTSTGPNTANWMGPDDCFTHVTDVGYSSLSTAHSLYILRPLNFTYATTAQAANTTTITVAYDPGTWATAGVYKYNTGAVPALANNTVASGDIVAFQVSDGSWWIDVCTTNTTGTTLVLTTGVPNVTGITLPAYSPIFFYGAVGDSDPATGYKHHIFDSVANTNVTFRMNASSFGLFHSLHKGDPLIFHSSNGTDAGTLQFLSGWYGKV